jgi:hypothetical protein
VKNLEDSRLLQGKKDREAQVLEERLEHMRRAGRARALVLEERRRGEQILAEEQVLQKQKENVCTLMMKKDVEQLQPRDVNEFEDDDDLDFLIDILLNDGPAKSDAKLHDHAREREIELLEREREIEASRAALRKMEAARDDLTNKLAGTAATHGKALADFSPTHIIEKAERCKSFPPKLGNPAAMAQTGANTQHHAHDEVEWFLANMRRSFSYIDLGEPPLEAR